ncbi:hypothetical protein [Helicobacter mesocricetorum]|uniref:hypothetical protein n=1 Tax=Helicobacter mesocricetorum TaxID=87012 RepID=UPI000CF136F5|nr:hypothetical protein [Helicobacter mesocricetorum]
MLKYGLIIILVAFLLFLLLQLLVSYNIISTKGKVFVAGFLIVIAVGIGVFTIFQDKSDDKLTSLAQLFLQDKNLQCQIGAKTLEVNTATFNFVSGTLTLVGKEDSPYFRTVIPLKNCVFNDAN